MTIADLENRLHGISQCNVWLNGFSVTLNLLVLIVNLYVAYYRFVRKVDLNIPLVNWIFRERSQCVKISVATNESLSTKL